MPKKITPEDIAGTPVDSVKPGEMAYNEVEVFSHEREIKKANLGWVGKVVGANSEKPGNISAIVLIVLLFFIGFLLFMKSEWDGFSDAFTALISTLTLILGYLFGSGTRD